MTKRAGCVDYVAICFATGEIVAGPGRYAGIRLAAAMETIVRHDRMPERGFATAEACAEAVKAATIGVTPAVLVGC